MASTSSIQEFPNNDPWAGIGRPISPTTVISVA